MVADDSFCWGKRLLGSRAFLGVCIAICTVAVFARVGQFGFISLDDPDYVSDNLNVSGGVRVQSVIWAFAAAHFSNWHPLTWLSHMLDCDLFGLNPGAHHLVNVLLHAANAVLLFRLFSKITGRLWCSLVVALLFALHPLHVESVAWVSERKDTLSALFWVVTILAYVRYTERPGLNRYAVTMLLFTAGLLSKPMVVTLPFVLLLLDYWPLYRIKHLQPSGVGSLQITPHPFRWLILEKIPLIALSVVSSVITFLAQRHDAMVSLDVLPLNIRIANAVVSYTRYLWKMLVPLNPAVIYPLLPDISAGSVMGALIILVSLTILAVRHARSRPYLLIGWLWYLASLVPVIGLVQVGEQAMADRYTYLPLIGIFLALVWGVADFAEKLKVRTATIVAISAVILGTCAAATSYYIGYWRDDFALFSQAVTATEDNSTAHALLADALVQRGEDGEAARNLEEALRIRPQSAKTHYQCGLVQAKQKQYEKAVFHYREAVQLRPDYADAYNELGVALSKLGRLAEAAESFTAAIERNPRHAKAYNHRGIVWSAEGQSAAALHDYSRALELNPNQLGALNNLAWLQATDEDPTIRNGPDALKLARRACELTRFNEPHSLEILAASQAEIGDFDEAIKTVQKALDVLPASQKNESDQLFQRLLVADRLYHAHQPFRRKSSQSNHVKT